MNFQKKLEVSKKLAITAKTSACVQEMCKEESNLREKSKTILNGRVKSERELESGSVGEQDLEYEFLYSVSDDENADHYSYEFDTYPVVARSGSVNSDKSNTCKDSQELVDRGGKNDSGKSEKYYGIQNTSVKRGRSKSASVRRPHNSDTLFSRSASVSAENKTGVALFNSAIRDRTKSSEITKEVAFRDTETVVSQTSSCRSKQNAENKSKYQRRKSVSYDPDLEKASAYIHGGGKNFSRSNTSLAPVKYGMKHLQMNYTETNLETNQTVIFLDLLKNSHQKSHIRSEQIRHIERRLEVKRNNPLYSTSFYEHKKIPDPFHRNTKKVTRTVAQKKIERKEKIKQMTDEIHTGYVPTQLTMRIADREEVEDIGRHCRYLRCQPISDQ